MPSTIKSQLSHYQQMQLKQIKYLNDVADAFQNRTKSIALRKGTLEKQKMKNYNTEYERIQNHVANSATPSLNTKRLTSKSRAFKINGSPSR